MAKPKPRHVSRPDSELIEEFLPTVRYWARHYAHRAHQTLEFDDLVVAGLVGLMDAHTRFNPRHNTQFKTYAEFRIRGEIVDELRRQDWLTRGERQKQKIYRRMHDRLGQELGRDPTRGELARVLPFPSQDLDRVAQYEQKDNLRPYLEGDHGEEGWREDAVAEDVETHDEAIALLSRLPPLLRTVMEQRYFEEAPLSVIAERLGLSEGRISQMHTEAVLFLRSEAA